MGANDMATIFNEAFINKVKENKNKIPTAEDPMLFYKNNVKTGKNKFKFKFIYLNKNGKTCQ